MTTLSLILLVSLALAASIFLTLLIAKDKLDYYGVKEDLTTIGLVVSIFACIIGIVKVVCYLFGVSV